MIAETRALLDEVLGFVDARCNAVLGAEHVVYRHPGDSVLVVNPSLLSVSTTSQYALATPGPKWNVYAAMDLLLSGAWLSRISQYEWAMRFLGRAVDAFPVNVLVLRVFLNLAVVHRILVLIARINPGLCAARSKS